MTSEESSRELTKKTTSSYNDDSGQDDSLKENFNNPANKSEI
jgi:ATP-dependent Clp protease ATP-binding subunit ClpC